MTESPDAIRFQRDLYLYWREARAAGGLALTSRGFVTRSLLRRLHAALAAVNGASPGAEPPDLEAEGGYLFYLRRLLERLSLLRRAPDTTDRLAATDASEMSRYLDHPLTERLRICARLWVAGGWWPDAPDARAPLPRLLAPAPPQIALARRTLLESLAHMAADEATPLATPSKAAASSRRARSPSPAQSREHRHPLRSHQPSPLSLSPAASETQRAALLGPLAWMGFVALQPSGAAPTSYRAAAACAALQPETTPDALSEPHGRVVAQPDFSLIAYPPLTAPLLLALDTCADVVALDQTARYQLSRAAVARARQASLSAPEIAAKLETLTGTSLPDNVRISLHDWGRQLARVSLTRAACVFTVEQPAILDALAADRAATAWIMRRLTPTAALIAADAAPRVREWLLRHGHFPALSQVE